MPVVTTAETAAMQEVYRACEPTTGRIRTSLHLSGSGEKVWKASATVVLEMRVVRALVLGLVVAAVGCGGSDAEEAQSTTSTSGATSTTAAAPCGEEGAEAVTFTTGGGAKVNAALLGDGEVGVVLGHQLRSDFCSWVPFAKKLAERNMRALAINFASASPDEDMVAGAAELRRRGAERIILVGASMGGTAALVAAAKIDVAAVAALSAPRLFSGLDALPSVRRLGIRALFLVGGQDVPFARDARQLHRATKSRDKDLVVTAGYEHGTDLLRDPQAERSLLDFLVSASRA
jgi:pimeloyl-ACP methyl ester carboxylesterase